MKKELKDLAFLLEDKLSDLSGEVICSSGHEHNTQIFRPFSPSQYEEVFLKEVMPLIDNFLKTATEEDKWQFFRTKVFNDIQNIKNPIPKSVDGEYAPNYAIVIINDNFYLLTNQWFRLSLRFMKNIYYVSKNTMDIYSFVNTIAETKNNYSIGVDDFSYFINKEEKDYRYSEIQLGFDKKNLTTVKLSCDLKGNNTVITVIDKEGNINVCNLEKDKAFVIAGDTQCYCKEVKLTRNGFKLIESNEGTINNQINMYPDISVLDYCTSLSKEDFNLDINCCAACDNWYDKRNNEIEELEKNNSSKEFIELVFEENNDGDMPF